MDHDQVSNLALFFFIVHLAHFCFPHELYNCRFKAQYAGLKRVWRRHRKGYLTFMTLRLSDILLTATFNICPASMDRPTATTRPTLTDILATPLWTRLHANKLIDLLEEAVFSDDRGYKQWKKLSRPLSRQLCPIFGMVMGKKQTRLASRWLVS